MNEWLLAAAIAVPVLTILGAEFWLAYRMGRQDSQLEWQSRAIEKLMHDAGSIPPPRQKLTTLTGSHDDRKMWDAYLLEAERLNREKDR